LACQQERKTKKIGGKTDADEFFGQSKNLGPEKITGVGRSWKSGYAHTFPKKSGGAKRKRSTGANGTPPNGWGQGVSKRTYKKNLKRNT